jgi:hypothetical protein
MHHGVKSELLDALMPSSSRCTHQPPATCVVLDGSMAVHMAHPKSSLTFEEYCNSVFAPMVLSLMQKHMRVDIVWDRYIPNSLKSSTRHERGTGAIVRVTPTTKVPGNWQDFLRVNGNKTELFHLIAEYLLTLAVDTVDCSVAHAISFHSISI